MRHYAPRSLSSSQFSILVFNEEHGSVRIITVNQMSKIISAWSSGLGLVLQSGGPGFKASTLSPAGFVSR